MTEPENTETVAAAAPASTASPGFGDLVATIPFPMRVEQFVWDPAGAWIAGTFKEAVSDGQGGLAVFDSVTGHKRVDIRDGPSALPLGLAAGPDGTKLAWTYMGGTSPNPAGLPGLSGRIRVVDPRSETDVWSAAPGGLVPAFSFDNKHVLLRHHLGNADIDMHAAGAGELQWTGFRGGNPTFSPDSTMVLNGGASTWKLAATETGNLITQFTFGSALGGPAQFIPDGTQIAGFVWDPAPAIERFHAADGTPAETTAITAPDAHQFDSATRRMAFSGDARLLALADDAMLAVFDAASGQPRFTPHIALGPTRRMMSFSHDNRYLAVFAAAVTILDTASGEAVFQQPFPNVNGVFFSPGGDAFAVTGTDDSDSLGYIKVFGTGHGAVLQSSAKRSSIPPDSARSARAAG